MVIGDGAIGSTGVFGASDLGSSPSPRASHAESAPLASLGTSVDGVVSRAVGVTQLIVPGPCRLCGGPTWMQDELGSVHPCCQLWNRGDCPACKASEALNREQRRRGPRHGWKEVKGEGVDG